MEYLTANNILFGLLSAVILIGGLLSVTTEKLMHAALYLFLTLLGIAGLYLQLNYEFLAAVEVSVYAGGIVVLLLFAIVLVHRVGERSEKVSCSKKGIAAIAAISGLLLVISTLFIYEEFGVQAKALSSVANEYTQEINMNMIGESLLGSDKYQYLLPFEASGILLLACIIGAVAIANKQDKKEDKK